MSSSSIASKPVEALHTRAAKGGLVSGVSFALNLGLNLVQVPLLLRFWPQETYGLWLSVSALAGLLTSLDGGHQSYVGNLLSRHYVESRAAFQRTLASAVSIAAVTAAVQIVLALMLCLSGRAADWLDVETVRAAEFGVAVAIYTVGWISVGSVGSILVRLFSPTGHFVRSMWWGIGVKVVQFAVLVIAAWMGWGLVGTAAVFAGTVFVVNILMFIDIRRLFPEFFPWWHGARWKEGFTNLAKSGVVTVVSVLDFFSLQGVVLLVSGGLGAALVPLFTTLRTMANMAMQGTGFLLNPIQPDLVRYHVQREYGKIGAVFSFFWFSTGLLINGGMIVALLVVEPVYTFWTQGKLPFDRALFAWLAAGVLVRTLAAPLQSYLTAINQLRALSITSVVRAAITVGGVLLLSHRWGLAGVGAALFLAELVGSLIMPVGFAAQELVRLGGKIPIVAGVCAAGSTLLSGVVLGCFVWQPHLWFWGGTISLGLQLLLARAQWAGLSDDLKRRVLAVTRGFARRGPVATGPVTAESGVS